MARQPSRQRQKALQRKLEKRKEKRRRQSGSAPRIALSRTLPRNAGEWPLKECLIAENWRKPGEIVQVLISRHGPLGQIGVGVFLVDLGCLGVKNALGYQVNPEEYARLCKEIKGQQKMVPADLNLAAKIIREGIAYAERLGFTPHRDYRQAQPILGNADPDACKEEIPLGKDGKPFYIAGPYDNVKQVMDRLTRAVGPDGFIYLVPLHDPTELGDLFGE